MKGIWNRNMKQNEKIISTQNGFLFFAFPSTIFPYFLSPNNFSLISFLIQKEHPSSSVHRIMLGKKNKSCTHLMNLGLETSQLIAFNHLMK